MYIVSYYRTPASEARTYLWTVALACAYKYIMWGVSCMTLTKPLPGVGLIDNGKSLTSKGWI